MSAQYITTREFLSMTVYLAVPVYLIVAVLQIAYSRLRTRSSWARTLIVLAITLVAEITLTAVLWLVTSTLKVEIHEPIFMLFNFLNLFALIAALIVAPAVTVLLSRRPNTARSN